MPGPLSGVPAICSNPSSILLISTCFCLALPSLPSNSSGSPSALFQRRVAITRFGAFKNVLHSVSGTETQERWGKSRCQAQSLCRCSVRNFPPQRSVGPSVLPPKVGGLSPLIWEGSSEVTAPSNTIQDRRPQTTTMSLADSLYTAKQLSSWESICRRVHCVLHTKKYIFIELSYSRAVCVCVWVGTHVWVGFSNTSWSRINAAQ